VVHEIRPEKDYRKFTNEAVTWIRRESTNETEKINRFAIWFVLSCVIHIALFRSKLDLSLSVLQSFAFALLAMISTLPFHEMIHFCTMKLFGMKDVRIEVARDPTGIPSLRTVAQGEIDGGRRIAVFLAPFVLLTLVPDVVFLMADRIPLLFFIVAMCNAAGCYLDFMMLLKAGQEKVPGRTPQRFGGARSNTKKQTVITKAGSIRNPSS